ncbi:MAG: hypothetical protein JSV81_02015, partial [Anaerolineales bacterium]
MRNDRSPSLAASNGVENPPGSPIPAPIILQEIVSPKPVRMAAAQAGKQPLAGNPPHWPLDTSFAATTRWRGGALLWYNQIRLLRIRAARGETMPIHVL